MKTREEEVFQKDRREKKFVWKLIDAVFHETDDLAARVNLVLERHPNLQQKMGNALRQAKLRNLAVAIKGFGYTKREELILAVMKDCPNDAVGAFYHLTQFERAIDQANHVLRKTPKASASAAKA